MEGFNAMTSAAKELRLAPAPKGMLESARDFLRARLGADQPNIVIRRSDMPSANTVSETSTGFTPVSKTKIITGPITTFEQSEIDDLSRMRDALYFED